MNNEDDNEVGHLDMTWRPQRLVGVCKNPDGIQAITAFVITSSGTVNDCEFGVDVALLEGGTVLVISEELCPLIEDPDEFYALYKKTNDITDDEYFQRRLQMKQAVRDLFPVGLETRREFRIRLPFKVEPTSLKWQCVGTRTGHRLCHIDLLEKRRHRRRAWQWWECSRASRSPRKTGRPRSAVTAEVVTVENVCVLRQSTIFGEE